MMEIRQGNILNIFEKMNNLENTNNMFWIPVSDSKLETKDFPNINIPINNKNFSNTKDNFGFPDLE